jgi:hypothetical protein
MRLTTAALALAGLVAVARPAPAWNAVGHMTVAKAAYDDLSDADRKRVHAVLSRHPHYDSYLTKKRPDGVPVEEWVFLRAATWPDYVRPPLPPDKGDPAVVRYHRPDDHFADFPVFAKGAAPEFVAKIGAMPDKHDVICALKQRVAELGLRTAADEDRAVSLCWLLHLTGDIHQPLHCASLFTEKLFPQGDAGGNAIGLRFGPQKVPQRLHTFWDGLLGVTSGAELAEIKDTPEHAKEAYELACRKAAAVTKAHPRGGLDELKSGRQFKDWGAESLDLAKTAAYADGKVAEIAVRVAPFPAAVPDTVPEEPDGYSAKAREVADRRAALAGYRVADLLRRALPKE